MNRFMAGALGGTLATLPMTAVMLGLFQRLPRAQQYPLPPREITEVIVSNKKTAPHLNDQRLTWLSVIAHFSYGAATGALYPATAGTIGGTKSTALRGAGYGVGIWALSYLGWIPAAKILKPATAHPVKRNALMILAHIVWGAGTGWIARRLTDTPARAGENSP